MATLTRAASLLDKLQLKDVDPGACHGPDGLISDPSGKLLVSYNPTTGKPMAKVAQATPASYANASGVGWVSSGYSTEAAHADAPNG